MKKYLLFLFVSYSSFISASDDNVLNLLENLRQKSELYHQTKKEGAGIVTLYSRQELDDMQAYTLKDIIKSIPFFTYQEGFVSTPEIAIATQPVTYMPSFRLYIDDHEVSSTYFGSAFYVYGDMNLGFVDHIEIYQGGNGIEFGSEPSLSTIRVYSKNPGRENGGQLQLMTDNNSSSSGYIYYGGKKDDLEFSAYMSGDNIKRETFNYDNYQLSKNSEKSHFLITLKNKSFNLLLSRYDSLQDGFAGLGRYKNPTGQNDIDKYHQFINASYRFSDDLKAYFSIDDSSSQMTFHEENGFNQGSNSYFSSEWDENIYKTGLRGNQNIDLHDVKYGFEYAQKNLKPKSSSYDNVSVLNIIGPTKLNIYSLYFQDTYKLSANNRVIATFKMDGYSDNGEADDSLNPIVRIGYMHQFNQEYKAKVFLSHTYLYPSFFYTTTYSGKTQINPKLKPTQINNLVAEVTRSVHKLDMKLGFIYASFKDSVFYNPNVKYYQNNDKSLRMLSAQFKLSYKFDLFNSLDFNLYKVQNSDHLEYSSNSGATLRLLNKYKKFNFFNELVYRSQYVSSYNTHIDSGYDFSAGVTYDYNKKLSLNLKAENIFNKAIYAPVRVLGAVNSFDRKVLLGLEYSF
ncbi:MAG: TonB-dependent receptor [Pseudomonadota bacterium]